MSTTPSDSPPGTPPRTPTVPLSELLSDVLGAIPEEDRALAGRALTVPRLRARDEELAVLISGAAEAVGFVVVDGIVLKETTLATRSALEVLSAGDVLAPPLSRPGQDEVRAVSRYLAHGSVTLGVLDTRFSAAARHWPQLAADLHSRLARQAHRASAHLAMLHAPRVEDRIALLFDDLGERCGRVTLDGIAIDVEFTHELIGRLVGARRPTVSLALRGLADAGLLRRTADGRWIVVRRDWRAA